MNDDGHADAPALVLRDEPGAGCIISGPLPPETGHLQGRYTVRVFNGTKTVACVVNAAQISTLIRFLVDVPGGLSVHNRSYVPIAEWKKETPFK